MLDPQLGEIEFYLMKIGRLESDLVATQEELMAARLRLRTAEDYQIKYELLLKQYEQQSDRFQSYEIEESEKIGQLITLKVKDRDNFWLEKQNKLQKEINEKYTRQLNKVNEQLTNFKKKHERCGTKFDDQDILAFKNKKLQKQNQALEEKIAQMRKQYERTKEQQIKSIKQSISCKNKEKQENQRKIYREKIQQLQRNISNLQISLLDARNKADPQREKQIQKLKNILQAQMQKNNEQIYKLSQGFVQKNRQIQAILDDKLRTEQGLMNQKKQLREYIKTIEDKLYQKEKQHEIQLINLKERMSKIREDEAQSLKRQISKNQQNFNEQRQSWKIIIADKDKQIERIKNKFEDDTQRHKEDKAKQLKKIEQLKERLKQFEGEREAGQTQQLLKSMKDIEARQQDFNSYENGVTFLDRQLKKAISKIQQKNIEITKLLRQLNQVRKQSDTQINNLREKGRKDKKYHVDRIGQLQQEIRGLNQDIRTKQRQSKRKQKDLQTKIAQLHKQNASLKDMVQQMQRDYTRIADSKKAIQMSYREQREKGLTSKSDLTMIKKQKWLQMERQKNELEAIFKQKEEQLKNKHEIQIEKLRHQRDQLKSQNQILKGLAQSVRRQAGDDNKQNKQAIYSQYHKKMATLNLQIALTKNIYDALVQAKSRKTKQSKVSEFQKIDQDESNSQQNQDRDSPLKNSEGPRFLTGSDIPKLGMSFNPNNR